MASARRFFVCFCAMIAFFAADLYGQTFTGTIVGTVTDSTGAILPGAAVSITNVATGVMHETITNESGQFAVAFLTPGQYDVGAELPGFKKKVVSSITLQVEQRIRIDLSLEVGEITEVVEVSGLQPLLETESSSLGQVIENKRVVDLPLNGRQFIELSFLVPATHASAPGHYNAILQGVAVSSGGGRPTNNNFTLDGIDNNSPNCGYFSVSPSVDAVQEFKIQYSNYSAEFGRTGGAIINVATKSGTNEFHGSLFEFVRNDVFDARNFFNNKDRDGDGKADAEQLRRNQFGGSVGGPILKGKTFFFYNQEHLVERKATVKVGRVPDARYAAGDFSQAGFTIYDPLTTRPNPNFDPSQPAGPNNPSQIRDPFGGNRIPDNRINPVAKKALAFWPKPNSADPLRNYVGVDPVRRDNDQYNARVDHQLSSSDSLFGRYTMSRFLNHNPGTIPNMGDFDLDFRGQNIGLNWVHTFSPQLVNEARVGYNRLNFGSISPRQGTDFAGQLGIKGSPGSRLAGFPIFGIAGFTGLGDWEPYGNIDNIYQWVDIVSSIKGSHNLKFGIDIRRIQNDYYIARAPSGSYSLNGQYTGIPGTFLPDGFADFLLGFPASNEITYLGDIGRTRTTNWNAFFQDDWKVTKDLTINLGLRYELYTAPVDKFNRQGYMDPKTGELVYPAGAPLDNPIPGTGITRADLWFPHRQVDRESIIIGDKNNFAPRIGLAYQVPGLGNTIIRAGYGMSYVYFPFSDLGVNSQRLLPFALRPSRSSGAFQPTILNYDFDIGGARGVLAARSPFAVAGLDPNLQWGDVHQWSLNVQHQTAGGILVELGYLGNKASHLAQRFPTNVPLRPEAGSVQARRPFPHLAGVSQVQSDINNFYGAFTARVEKRFSQGFTFLTAYTWAKSLGYGSEVYGTPGQESGPQNPRNFKLERGLAPDDVRQRIAISSIWEVPFGTNRRYGSNAPSVLRFILGGWQVNTITAFQTGFHTTAVGGAFLNMGTSSRPDQIGNPNEGFKFSVDQAFNTKAFAKPEPFKFGTAPRGSIETPGQASVDLSLVKNNQITEDMGLQFRFEMFNMPNHANFGLPNRSFDSRSFGRISSAADPRLIQFGLKFIF